ncbi:zinc-ribbon domain-containing protein, partial [Ruminococcus sp.]|uniref:zinc-ribbon domain-containing protein n=1 Tax=Ruminococcus sp. TaxID=41978 RepID=UPI003AF1520B
MKLCPEVDKWWDYEANSPYRPEQFTKGSKFQAHFICPDCGMRLYTDIHSLMKSDENGKLHIRHEGKCLKFRSMKSDNNLVKQYPQIKEWWDYEENGKALPEEFTIHSAKRMHFICPSCGAKTYRRITDAFTIEANSGKPILFNCPYCRNKKALAGYNSLLDTNPELAKEWSDNNDLKASEVLPTSSSRVQWVCPTCRGKYYAAIRDRKVGDDACPYCQNDKLLPGYNSLLDTNPELAKEWSDSNNLKASEVLPTSWSRVKWVCPTCRGEYSAIIRDRKAGDDACPYCKNDKALVGFNSLQDKNPKLAEEWSDSNNLKASEVLPTSWSRVKWVCPTCRGEYSAIIRERKVGDDACPYCRNDKVLAGFNSLQYKNPELAKEWSANNVRKADEVLPTSSSRVKWVCPTCKGEYSAIIRDRKVGDDACPYCRQTKLLKEQTSLGVINPELAKEWSANNVRKADEVLPTSSSRALWICPTCRGEYYAAIRDRKVGDDACPYCKNDKVLPGFNSLQYKNPELAKEW